jgi:DNA-binding LytR/AlgR family response regulator
MKMKRNESGINGNAPRNILIRKGTEFIIIKLNDIAYFFAENKICNVIGKNNSRRLIIAKPLSEIETMVSAHDFYRVNKNYLVHIDAIDKIKSLQKGKVEIFLKPGLQERLLVPQSKTQDFKKWIVMGGHPSNLFISETIPDVQENITIGYREPYSKSI